VCADHVRTGSCISVTMPYLRSRRASSTLLPNLRMCPCPKGACVTGEGAAYIQLACVSQRVSGCIRVAPHLIMKIPQLSLELHFGDPSRWGGFLRFRWCYLPKLAGTIAPGATSLLVRETWLFVFACQITNMAYCFYPAGRLETRSAPVRDSFLGFQWQSPPPA